MQIPGVPAALLRALAKAADGRRLALVGGAVRDLLLHRVHNDPWRGVPDLDLVVEGRAAELVARLAQQLPPGALRSCREHGRFGTVEVELLMPESGAWLLDVASARREAYPQPAENPVVSLGRLDDDLARRDFSVNAIALLLSTDGCGVELLDPHGGQRDLAQRRLRLLHADSLHDDPTRLVRAARYAARLGFVLDPAAVQQAKGVLSHWPWSWRPGDAPEQAPPALGTRLRMELELLLEREPWEAALRHLQAWEGLKLLDPQLQGSGAWQRCLRRASRQGLPLLPVLLGLAGDPLAVAARLQLPHRQQRWLKGLVQLRQHLAEQESTQGRDLSPAEWTQRLEAQLDPTHVVPLALCCGDQPRKVLLRWWFRWRHVGPGLSASDLIAAGVPAGPAIGARLRQLRAERLNLGEAGGR
jgi:poly(A) polymerase